MKDIVIFGTGAMAEVVSVYLEQDSDFNIVGYTLDAAYRKDDSFNGKPLVDWETLEQHFAPDQVLLFGPLTYQKMNTVRRDRYLEGKARGYRFATFIHPGSHIYTDKIGENCLILEANVIQPFASIGDNVIIWSTNHIGHHVSIGDHCFIASQVGIAGNTSIGQECYLAGQVGVAHGLTVGDRCAVLNAAYVGKNLKDGAVITGDNGTLKPFDSTRLHGLI
ncbi:MAG: acetyltransferase [Rhodobacteraceae bacterium]|nr:acetyltransferase [Paracoccaceae bacterium]